MKTKLLYIAIFAFAICNLVSAQTTTTVNATNSDISDNLDLRAVASIFGLSANLEDFERRLNNPKEQISNLDLNNDRNVDYLRVIESVENNVHLVVIQAVLSRDVFQDVATVEVQRDNNNQVQVQVVGDVFMYGQNYIYEPIYVARPIIFSTFWLGNYNPYFSPYYWNNYPVYYSYWNPYPVFRYRRNINLFINFDNNYNYVNVRRCQDSYAMYSSRRTNGYERMNPNRSFNQRNANVTNRYELDRSRNLIASRGENNTGRNTNGGSRSQVKPEENVRNSGIRTNDNTNSTVRNGNTRTTQNTTLPTRNTTSRSVENGSDVITRNPTREIETTSLPVRSSNQNTTSRNNPTREVQTTRNSGVQPAATRGGNRGENSNQPRTETPRNGGRG